MGPNKGGGQERDQISDDNLKHLPVLCCALYLYTFHVTGCDDHSSLSASLFGYTGCRTMTCLTKDEGQMVGGDSESRDDPIKGTSMRSMHTQGLSGLICRSSRQRCQSSIIPYLTRLVELHKESSYLRLFTLIRSLAHSYSLAWYCALQRPRTFLMSPDADAPPLPPKDGLVKGQSKGGNVPKTLRMGTNLLGLALQVAPELDKMTATTSSKASGRDEREFG